MTMQSTSFWDFSNQIYERKGVARLCLRLQDDYQLDVNLLLFCCWSAHFEPEVSKEAWQRILKFSNQWKSQVVQPLRNARKWMKAERHRHQQKAEFTILRDRIKMDELAAEKYQQEFIEESVPEFSDMKMEFQEERASSYFSVILQAEGIALNEEISSQLRLLIKAITISSKE